MKAYRPNNLEELKTLLSELPDNSAFTAGGTDWVIQERRRSNTPECLVYLGCVTEMKAAEKRNDGLFIGAACTMTELENNPLLKGAWRVIAEAAASVGSVQIRNRATIGGNIANASPAADLAAPLVCLDAKALVLRENEIRRIPVTDFIVSSEKTLLEPKDVLLGFSLPEYLPDMTSHYYKLGFRRELSIARFGIAAALHITEDIIRDARVAVGSIGPKAVRMPEIENVLKGNKLTKQAAQESGLLLRDYIRNTSGRKYKAWASIGVMEDALGQFAPLA